MNEDRLIELETKYAHLDAALDELQKVSYEQHRTIERLTKDLKSLADRFEGAAGADVGSGDQKPPHY